MTAKTQYEVTVKVLVEAPENHTRSTEKWVHAIVQDTLPGADTGELQAQARMDGRPAGSFLRIIGASAISSVDVGPADPGCDDCGMESHPDHPGDCESQGAVMPGMLPGTYYDSRGTWIGEQPTDITKEDTR